MTKITPYELKGKTTVSLDKSLIQKIKIHCVKKRMKIGSWVSMVLTETLKEGKY